jgi:anti-sigma B factor antagonist
VQFPWQKTKAVSMNTDVGMVCDQHGSECQVSLSGRITIDSSPHILVFLLQRLRSPSCQSLTVDFYEVVYIDTSGLAMLLEILKAARTQGKTFHLTRLRERPRYLLETTRLLHLFDDSNQEGPQGSGPSENLR